MMYTNPEDELTDDIAVKAFTGTYGEPATQLAPVAIVIAAYNEEGAIGPVVEALPGEICGLATAVIVVADGCADGTAAEAAAAGAMVCDVPANRGQVRGALAVGVDERLDGGVVHYLVLGVGVDHACVPSARGSNSGQTVAMPAARS